MNIRSALFVPAANAKALAKAPTLEADAIIIDLEDAVAPAEKEVARAAALRVLQIKSWKASFRAVRINALDTPWGNADLRALATAPLHALVVAKMQSADALRRVRTTLVNARPNSGFLTGRALPSLWAMVETPHGILRLEEIAASAQETGLTTLIVGTNDLSKELRCDGLGDKRAALLSHLSKVVLVARGYDLMVLDGVYNAFDDENGFRLEAEQGKRLGFDGKSLIHPAQIAPANTIFGPDADAIAHARAIVRAFSLKKNKGKGVINLSGEMVERLHLHDAKALLDSLPALPAKTPSTKKTAAGKKKP